MASNEKAGNQAGRELELLDSILKKRGFFWQTEEIYGGLRGFFDYGVLGTKIKHNVLAIWRRLFVIEEGCLEMDGASINSGKVFGASGHLEKFVDIVTNCLKCGASYRADHLLKGHVENPDGMPMEEMDLEIEKASLRCQLCKGELSKTRTQNLMFELTIGREMKGYLRPETAQSIFTNFQGLYRYNREKLPFGVAQIGAGYRNEISPRQGLVRLREFSMAEVEFFYNQEDTGYLDSLREKVMAKDYPFLTGRKRLSFDQLMKEHGATLFDAGDRYGKDASEGDAQDSSVLAAADLSSLLDEKLPFVEANGGDPRELSISFAQALEQKVIRSPLLCHHLVLAYSFMKMLGFRKEQLRFRQHLPKEMAHYASDCWDLEIALKTGDGEVDWMESIGIADRSAFDLSSHIDASGKDFRVFEKFDEAKEVQLIKATPDMRKLGREFRKEAKLVSEALQNGDQDILAMLLKDSKKPLFVNPGSGELCLDPGKEGMVELPRDFFTLEETVEKITGRKFIPAVVEPSFGIGRIIYGLLNNAIHLEKKDGEDYAYFTLSPAVAPITAAIFPLTKDERLVELARELEQELRSRGLSTSYDASGSVGRRYARMDEIGTPFCITVDFDAPEDKAATIRFINTRQYRVPLDRLPQLICQLQKLF